MYAAIPKLVSPDGFHFLAHRDKPGRFTVAKGMIIQTVNDKGLMEGCHVSNKYGKYVAKEHRHKLVYKEIGEHLHLDKICLEIIVFL